MTPTVHADISAEGLLHLRFLSTARRQWSKLAMADSSGKELTYGRALAGSLALSRWIERHCAGQDMVGLMLPASVGGALANVATLMARKVPVNLNFTAGSEAIASAIGQCGIAAVLTSRQFLSKAKLEPPPGTRFLEDVMGGITFAQADPRRIRRLRGDRHPRRHEG